MASIMDRIEQYIIEAVKRATAQKTSPYDDEAEVIRIEGNTAWVHFAGGVPETPVKMTVDAKKGDKVQCRVTNNGAFIIGNGTSPPTDDTKANIANEKATIADEKSSKAIDYASVAEQAAALAQESASTAYSMAESAVSDAERAKDAADIADEKAIEAKQSADQAYASSVSAIKQLSVVEDIVGVLDLVAQNGDYQRTSDDTPQPNKWYFTRTGSGTTADPYVYQMQANPTFEYQLTADASVVAGKPYFTRSGSGTSEDPYLYTPVENPVTADIGTYYENTNWYYFELIGVDQTIQNYVSSHLVLVGDSLFLQTDDGQGSTRLELNTTNGLILYDQTGSQVAQYGTKASIGNAGSFHITVDPSNNEIGFWRGSENDDGNKVAYINGDTLYITRTVVLQEMKLGDTTYGTWAWRVHVTSGGQNNLYLKWLG